MWGILVLLIALALIGYFVYYSAEDGEDNGMAASKTYSNQTYGVSFEYPPTYFLEERQMGATSTGRYYSVILTEDNETNKAIREGRITNTEGPPAITLDIHPNQNREFVSKWVTTNIQNSNWNLALGGMASTTVGGLPAVSYTWDGLYRGDSAVVATGTNIYMFSATYNSPEDITKRDFPGILSSVRFLR